MSPKDTPPDPPRVDRLAPDSLVDLSYRSIREGIVMGRFAMGERLVETRLAEELGTSRAPIREAFRRLADENLVVERPRHGVFVRAFTGRDFVDLYNARIAVESATVRLAMRRVDQTLALLKPPMDQMWATARANDQAALVDAELSFHRELCRAAENSYLMSSFETLSTQVRLALALDDAHYENLGQVVVEHEPLLEAIQSGDEELAARTMEEHIVHSVGPVLVRLGGDSANLLGRSTTG